MPLREKRCKSGVVCIPNIDDTPPAVFFFLPNRNESTAKSFQSFCLKFGDFSKFVLGAHANVLGTAYFFIVAWHR